MATKESYEIDLGGFTSSDSNDEYEEKKIDIHSSTPGSRSSHSNNINNNNNNNNANNNGVSRQLSAYYGTPNNKNNNSNNNPTEDSQTGSISMSHDELRYDFKSKYFNANKFVEKKVSNMTVSELVNYSNELNHGVKALDSEMQMMVYDNYNKFISATDTIRKMKDQVENMETEMSKLLNNMNSIANNCIEIENKFSTNRSEIEKLVSVRHLLKKLEFLFELPNRLKKNIQLCDYERAIKYFKMATKILIKYKQ
eukprot:307116_1